LPLFSDDERKEIGTTYKKVSKEKAIKKGVEYFGPKMKGMIEEVENILLSRNDKQVVVYCWRGGMRSGAVAWLLDLYGFEVFQILGGYKAYRNWVINVFKQPFNLNVVGGYTGSNKTMILHELIERGKQVIDLEGLARHKGSTFGHLGEPSQPSQEQFENNLAQYLLSFDKLQTIYIEDESVRLGLLYIPQDFFIQMQKSKMFFIELPFEERLNNVVKQYGNFDKTQLIEGIKRIEKRLGGLDTKNAINFLNENKISDSFEILLMYYDRYYLKNLEKRKTYSIEIEYINNKSLII
jgi:tRNA 2-selenouridine synthase